MTRAFFTSDINACKRLNEFLNDPIVQIAFSIALKEVQPSHPSQAKGDLIQQAAISGMQTLGANSFIAGLQSLTNPSKVASQQNEYDQSAVDVLVQQGYSKEEAIKAVKDFNSTQ